MMCPFFSFRLAKENFYFFVFVIANKNLFSLYNVYFVFRQLTEVKS